MSRHEIVDFTIVSQLQNKTFFHPVFKIFTNLSGVEDMFKS